MDAQSILIPTDDLIKIRDSFLDQLNKAQNGQNSDFSFLKTRLDEDRQKSTSEFQIIVIGGSKFREAHIKCEEGKLHIKDELKSSVPVFSTGDIFKEFVHKNLSERVNEIFINFAFPISPQIRHNRLDGILKGGTKEHEFKGLTGELVGESIEKYISGKSGRKISVSLANDVVCLTASGLPDIERSKLAGCIIGTGINLGFFIDGNIIVNAESACFSSFDMSRTGKIVDEQSVSPGFHLFEKEISGAYLYKHFNILVAEKLIEGSQITSTHELSDVAQTDLGQRSQAAQFLLERSAQYTAVMFSALHCFLKQDCLFCPVEGSLFWKGYNYRQNVEKYLNILSLPQGSISFLNIPSSDIVGAVRLMCNS